jgi:DNA-binding XRE family transcriptional regulator
MAKRKPRREIPTDPRAVGRRRNLRPENVGGCLGEQVEMRRKTKGLTAAQLAEQAGVGRSTVTNIEAAIGSPSLDTVAAIAKALGVKPRDLLAGCDGW